MIYNLHIIRMQACLVFEVHPWPFDQQREQPREEEEPMLTNAHALIPQSQDTLLEVN
jgi:hypothetical protein